MSMLSNLQRPDRPNVPSNYAGPRVAAIYGFASREHMQRHLLRFLRDSGYPDTTMYGHLQANLITNDLHQAAMQGRPIVLLGFSQGGFEAMTVARELNRRGVRVSLLVPIAARGLGRLWPHRWNFDMRSVSPNVELCLNYFSVGDVLGSDARLEDNLVLATDDGARVENIGFPRSDKISHLVMSSCYPAERLNIKIKALLLDRLLSEMTIIQERYS